MRKSKAVEVSYRAKLEKVVASLPDPPDGLEEQAAALILLVLRFGSAEARDFESSRCPNCGGEVPRRNRPYCSDSCRETAALVRQMRRAIDEGSLLGQERQASIGAVLWHLQGGGYPLRIAMIPASVMRKVIDRADGKCELCGSAATTVDHVRTACNRPINLRAVCDSCTKVRPFGDPRLLELPENQSLIKDIANRVSSEEPRQECDDPVKWDWRDFMERRKAAL